MNPNKIKVYLCITKSAPWGGAQKYVYDIATNVPKDAIDMTVLLGGDGELKNKLIEAGVHTLMLPNSQRDAHIKKDLNLLHDLIKLFRKDRPDVLHLNSSKIGFIGALAGRLAGIKKIIFIAHGWSFNEERPWYQKVFFRILHVCTILLSHTTIAVSQITKDQIGLPWNKKITVIRNGVTDINFLTKAEARKMFLEKIPQHPTLAKDTLWVGTISELHTTKGLKYAIEAISKIQHNIIFVIIGEGHDRKNTERLITELNLSHRVFLMGKIDSASTYIKAFDIFTLTSITEALPYTLLEAGSAGLPIIASRVGGIPEIIDNNSGILVRSRNPKDIQNGIEFLLKNPDQTKFLGQNLKKKIATDFTQKMMLEKTFALYKM